MSAVGVWACCPPCYPRCTQSIRVAPWGPCRDDYELLPSHNRGQLREHSEDTGSCCWEGALGRSAGTPVAPLGRLNPTGAHTRATALPQALTFGRGHT